MTLAERGAYRELLDFCWMEGEIPDDLGAVARLLGVSVEEAQPIWEKVRLRFDSPRPGILVSPRMEKVREEMLARAAKASAAATARWEKDKKEGKHVPSRQRA